MEHRKAFWASSPFWYLLFFFLTALPFFGKALSNENVTEELLGPVVEKHQRKTLTNTEYGEVSAIDIHDGHRPPYHLQFFTLEPNSLFLPVLLHADMVFYVQTGSFMFLIPLVRHISYLIKCPMLNAELFPSLNGVYCVIYRFLSYSIIDKKYTSLICLKRNHCESDGSSTPYPDKVVKK